MTLPALNPDVLRAFRRAAPFVLALAGGLPAQTPAAKFVDSARVEIDRAAAARDADRLARADLLLERALVVFPSDPWLLHYRGYAAYRRAILALDGDRAAADKFLERAADDLERSAEKLPWPETPALQSAVAGLRISLSPMRGMTLGMQVGEFDGRAATLGAGNPRVLLLQAHGARNTPAEYGGSVERAKELARRAMKAFETDKPGPLAPAWGKDECAWLLKSLGVDTTRPPPG